ncbi:MAG: CHASE2 domain-containing protein [Limnothrix sp.]
MTPRAIRKFYPSPTIFKVATGVSILVALATLTGLFQTVEWLLWDRYFRWRPHEVTDPNIVVVTINENDIRELGEWPISDELLAQLLIQIKAQNPSMIGLNLFRNLPIREGAEALEEIYRTTPNLITAKKTVGIEVAPPSLLEQQKQVGFSDIIVDQDGKVRRSIITITNNAGETEESLATKLATGFLKKEGIEPKIYEPRWRLPFDERKYFRLGDGLFTQLFQNDGGYVRTDNGGFQLLLNYRSEPYGFDTISIRELMNENIPPRLVRDVNQPILENRIVLIGSISDSNGASLHTPFLDEEGKAVIMPGVFVHAHTVSQLVRAAKDGRSLFFVWSQEAEWLWLFGWAVVGAGARWYGLKFEIFNRRLLVQNFCLLSLMGTGAIALIGFGYGSFLAGWWVPLVPAYLAFAGSAMIMGSYHSHELQKLATLDALTQIANRRYFEEYLYQVWWKCEREKQPISLIMCDIDHFKLYNDHYGHQLGDRCLQQVVASIQETLRTSDLMARYGGEEFVIILPNTGEDGACHVANRICQKVEELHLNHDQSPTKPYVTVSCGVSSVLAHSQLSPVELISSADKALYKAKAKGRNGTSFQPYQNLPPLS